MTRVLFQIILAKEILTVLYLIGRKLIKRKFKLHQNVNYFYYIIY